MLEAQGIVPDIVVGTSAGSLVGALYASGYNGFELQRIGLQLEDSVITDWSLPDRGFLKGEALQRFVNQNVQNRPLEKLNKPFGAVATDLQSGEAITFRTGNTGTAVRASSSVPGVFQPVSINGRDYVDGGLVSPVPVRAARTMGADVVIAVDISNKPSFGKTGDSISVQHGCHAGDCGLHFQRSASGANARHHRYPVADLLHHGSGAGRKRTGRSRCGDPTRGRQSAQCQPG